MHIPDLQRLLKYFAASASESDRWYSHDASDDSFAFTRMAASALSIALARGVASLARQNRSGLYVVLDGDERVTACSLLSPPVSVAPDSLPAVSAPPASLRRAVVATASALCRTRKVRGPVPSSSSFSSSAPDSAGQSSSSSSSPLQQSWSYVPRLSASLRASLSSLIPWPRASVPSSSASPAHPTSDVP